MPLNIATVNPKVAARAALRAIHAPLRFTVWVAPHFHRRETDFAHALCSEQDLRRIAEEQPRLSYLELMVVEDAGWLVAYLGRRIVHRGHPRTRHPADLRAKLVIGSDALLSHLHRTLHPGTLERIHAQIRRTSKKIELAAAELHRRREVLASTAHFLVPLLTPEQEFPSSRPASPD